MSMAIFSCTATVPAVFNKDDETNISTDELVSNIIQLIDDKQYFAINCARQYGKTTTLNALSNKIFEMRLYKQFLGDVVKVKNIS